MRKRLLSYKIQWLYDSKFEELKNHILMLAKSTDDMRFKNSRIELSITVLCIRNLFFRTK